MAKKAKVKAGAKTKSKSGKKSGAQKVYEAVTGSKTGGGGKGKRKSPDYWAKKVLVEKLKRKFFRLKYGGSGR